MCSRPLVALSVMLVAGCGSDGVNGLGNTTGVILQDTTTVNPTPVTVGFVSKSLVDGGVTYRYQVFIPANYNSVSKVPVILFMHGSGEKGSDNTSQLRAGLGPVVKAQASTFSSIVVFPQGPLGDNEARIAFIRISLAALNQTVAEYSKADQSRLYLTGLSYGGINGYELAYNNPTKFAAFVPIAASICAYCFTGSFTATAEAIAIVAPKVKALPIYQFQGELDPAVKTADVRLLVQTLRSMGSPILYKEYAGAGHEVWDQTYASAEMWAWLYAQKR